MYKYAFPVSGLLGGDVGTISAASISAVAMVALPDKYISLNLCDTSPILLVLLLAGKMVCRPVMLPLLLKRTE